MVGLKTSEPGVSVQLFQSFEPEYFKGQRTGSEYVTRKAYHNALFGVVLIDFHMGLGLYRWQYLSHGMNQHKNVGFFLHKNTQEALHAGVTYFHIFTSGKYRSYNIWWE